MFPPCFSSSRAHTGEADRGGEDANRVVWARFPGLDDVLFNTCYSVVYTQYVKRPGFETVR